MSSLSHLLSTFLRLLFLSLFSRVIWRPPPLRQAIINSINTQLGHHITVHFSRFAVTTISLTPSALGHFEVPHILATPELLAHAQVDVIGWSGTAAGWLGFGKDVELCKEIKIQDGDQSYN
ncbi:hypothetical protein WAI453_004164 [Rhynchosporium graminicola]